MSIHGTRQLNGFSNVVNIKPQYQTVYKKAIWTNVQVQKLIKLVQSIELTTQRTDWELVAQQIGLSSKQCKDKYYQLTKKVFSSEVSECFIMLTKKVYKSGADEMNWKILEEYFNKPSSWLQNKYNEIVYDYFTEEDIKQIKTFVETSEDKIKWKLCQHKVGFSYSSCYQMFMRLYKEQMVDFTTELENKLKQIDKGDINSMKQLSAETGIELCYLKFWKMNGVEQ